MNLSYANARRGKQIADQITGIDGLTIVTDEFAAQLIIQKLERTK